MLKRHPSVPYIAPFLAFVGLMAIERLLPFPATVLYPIRFVLVLAVILAVSRPVLSFRTNYLVGSVGIGLLVFAIWIGPDLLWPGYRSHWLFTNVVTGAAESSLSNHARLNPWFLAIRFAGCTLLVPVLEELFWRGWLMRYLIHHDFQKVPMGTFTVWSFWLVAFLFASEHGPYWEVGLIAGAIYNWWIVRTKSLADCMVAHAVTNCALSCYVLGTGQWQYWL